MMMMMMVTTYGVHIDFYYCGGHMDDGDDGDDGVNLRGALTATLHVLLKNEFSEALTRFFAG